MFENRAGNIRILTNFSRVQLLKKKTNIYVDLYIYISILCIGYNEHLVDRY